MAETPGRAQLARASMVHEQLVPRGIDDERVLAAMTEVPRERFVPLELRDQAYADRALPVAAGQTISQPYVVALMAQLARVDADDVVLEVGAGTGYAAAVLARLARRVVAVERIEELAATARERLAALGVDGVEVVLGDGSVGWREGAPYDAIVVSAGAPTLPEALVDQLASGGRLVAPVGPQGDQRLVLVEDDGGQLTRTDLGPVAFVPLVGEGGWPTS